MSDKSKFPRTESEWRVQLSPLEFNVLRQKGTERAFSHAFNALKDNGEYLCRGCDAPLFSSAQKYESGSGWPSFFDLAEHSAITTQTERTFFAVKTEIICARCRSHIGHLFSDGPQPSGKRYCTNGTALRFAPALNPTESTS